MMLRQTSVPDTRDVYARRRELLEDHTSGHVVTVHRMGSTATIVNSERRRPLTIPEILREVVAYGARLIDVVGFSEDLEYSGRMDTMVTVRRRPRCVRNLH
jgi:hypothetical protein